MLIVTFWLLYYAAMHFQQSGQDWNAVPVRGESVPRGTPGKSNLEKKKAKNTPKKDKFESSLQRAII